MHELSIALSIIDGVEEQLASRPGAEVSCVRVRVGPLSGVLPDALLSAFGLACEGTPLEGSRLMVEETPVIIYCRRCASEQSARSIQELCCSACGTPATEVRSGTELELFALELFE